MPPNCLSDVSLNCASVDQRCNVCRDPLLRRKFSVLLSDGPYRNIKGLKHRPIYECESCGHLSANLCDSSLNASYYASLSEEYYCCHDDEQSRYEQILQHLPKQRVRKVLDIGCGTGTFLAMLPSEAERFGIEPSRAAAEHAKAKGIQIIDYSDLARPELRNSFDLVTAIDVVEHLSDLQEFRRQLTKALCPGGTVIILTGDAKSASARLLGRYWLYVNYAEHINFFCRNSARVWLQNDFSVIEVTETNHHRLDVMDWLSLVRAWLFFPVKWILRKVLPMHIGFYTALSLPGDHMLIRAIRNRTVMQ